MNKFLNSLFALAILIVNALQTSGAIGSETTAPETQADNASEQEAILLDRRFEATVKPFIQSYCISCHGADEPEAGFNLSIYSTMASAVEGHAYWQQISERVELGDMPPEDAVVRPTPAQRDAIVTWISDSLRYEATRNSGDPGMVLARRLSNSEYDYTIRDLTGVDLRPTCEFQIDPTNQAGFDNSGESLFMSPTLLDKYLKAARSIADHMFLQPEGFSFAPTPMIVETDRDQYCVSQIINFYHQHNIDYADYFEAAWMFKHRAALQKPNDSLDSFASELRVSPKYLATIWDLLESDSNKVGPLNRLRIMWVALPAPTKDQSQLARQECEAMRDFVVKLRKKLEMRFLNIAAGEVRSNSQPLLIWKNVQYATHRRDFDRQQLQIDGELQATLDAKDEPGAKGDLGPGSTQIVVNQPGDPDLFVPADQRQTYEASFVEFCRVFPDMFYKQERGRNYFDTKRDKGRYLSAGFHNIMGYFRDDQPLYELLLASDQQRELDRMWDELDFVASAISRMYVQFYRSGGPREGRMRLSDSSKDIEPSDESSITSELNIAQLKDRYVELAQSGPEVGKVAVNDYFDWVNDRIRWLEKSRADSEALHLEALLKFAARAYRRPLSNLEDADLLNFYRSARVRDGMDHETAMRESIVAVLMYPDMCYRIDDCVDDMNGREVDENSASITIRPLTDSALASRLSYFLWSSIPDEELLSHVEAGDLHEPSVVASQARRMIKDPRARALAVEFGGSWLDFRHFGSLNTVDLERFPSFTGDLRDAMFEEPVRYLMEVIEKDRSILDLLFGNDTFVNPVLAKHYGIPFADSQGNDQWTHVENAADYGRGGLLPMAVFLTKNAPGLRTSPVKRGNWVVKNLLGERIAPPPPGVPELPQDEAKSELSLREVLARHRENASCSVCHERFDSFGLVFEGFGPIGEIRAADLGGRAIDANATFPDGSEGNGVPGVKAHLRDQRQADFVDNFNSKLLVYALGRSLLISDRDLIEEMNRRLADNGFRFSDAIECIVTSKQFLNKRADVKLAVDQR